MRTNWSTHKGKQILVADYTGIIHEGEMMEVLYSTPQLLLTQPTNATILYIVDVSNAVIGQKFRQISQRIENEIFYCYNKKRAIVGMSMFDKFIFALSNITTVKKTAFFNTREEAVEYLTQQNK